jgi:hypothetical protein
MIGWSDDVEDLGFVNEFARGFRVLIVIGQGLHDGQLTVVPVELNLSALVHEVVVVLSIVEVKISSSSACFPFNFDFRVDKQVDWVIDRLEQRHALLFEVKQRDDTLLANEDALFILCNRDCLKQS